MSEQIDLSSFYLYGVGIFRQKRDISTHMHSMTELVFVSSGECSSHFAIGPGKRLQARSGMCFVIPAHLAHDQKGDCSTIFIQCQPVEEEKIEQLQLFDFSADSILQEWIKQASELWLYGFRAEARPLCEAIWKRIYIRYISISDQPETKYSLRLMEALNYISQNYRQAFSAHELARFAHCSVSQLNLEFRKAYNLSTMEYVYQFRLKTAKNMLSNDYLSIGEIADFCGFSSANYFIRAFHKYYGITPGEARQLTVTSGQ